MKATGNFENARNVDPMVVLSDATRAHIDHWLAKFPPDRKRSAVLQGLHAAQEQNGGWLSDELIAAVAKYLSIPPVWAYEVASFYSMFETEKVGRHNVAFCTNISCWLNGAEQLVEHAEKKLLRAGANKVVSPYVIGGARVAQAVLRPTVVDFIELATRTQHLELQIEETQINARSLLVGTTLRDSQLRQALGIILVAIKKKSGEMIFNPAPEAVLEANDILITLGHRQQLDQLQKLASGTSP